MKLFVRYKSTSNKSEDKSVLEMHRLVKAFAANKLKYGHIQRYTLNFRPPEYAFLEYPCTYATGTKTHVRVEKDYYKALIFQTSATGLD